MKKDGNPKVEEKKEKKNILLLALKKHKISLAILLFFVCTSGAMAWFIYNKTVNFRIFGHVRAWDIQLGDGEEEVLEFDLSDLYPGMTEATDSVMILNNGEMDARITLAIQSLTLFGEEQVQGTDYTVTNNSGVYTISGYPFELSFTLTDGVVAAGGVTSLSFVLNWDYDNNEAACQATDSVTGEAYNKCDQEDTEMGEQSYAYSQTNPNDPSISIELRLQFVEDI